MSHWTELSFPYKRKELGEQPESSIVLRVSKLAGSGGLAHNCSKADRRWWVLSLPYFKQMNIKKPR